VDVQKTPLRETAATWHESLQGDSVPHETRAAFDAWLAESPAHRDAYETIERAWRELLSVAHDPQILELRHETALRLTRRTSITLRRLPLIAAAAIILLTLGVALTTAVPDLRSESPMITWLANRFHVSSDGRYATGTGERLTVALEDGSQITLNTQTELRVALTRATRSVRLLRGQALFDVAKDQARPFIVEAQDRRFVAVGTAFDVRIEGEEVKLTMLTGTVRAERAAAPSASMTTVTAGEQLTADSRAADRVRPADPERVTSWRRGQVIFEDTPLKDAIEDINRYSMTQIELADPKLQELHLSGAFATGSPSVFIEAVTAYFPVKVTRRDNRRIVLASRE
jgi:transmembrane sensor